jgi:hypothetical protein
MEIGFMVLQAGIRQYEGCMDVVVKKEKNRFCAKSSMFP